MAMEKVIGATLETGVTESGLDNVLEQGASVKKLGEIKEYKDKDGAVKSVYKTSDCERREVTFDVILKENAATNIKVGQTMKLNNGEDVVVTAFEITESNDDVKKARMTVRTLPDVNS